ncbi:MAG: phosphoribosylformimino-5-aminoimidazole carboxamide ribotide isomerase [Thermodesulfobacteriota bacterium]
MRFRPCIDLHQGQVKQIVGSTLADDDPGRLTTNFASGQPAAFYADLYRRDDLPGGHVIMLGPGNETAARQALAAYPGGLQIGGGITAANAGTWLDAGAAAVIVTSFVFRDGQILYDHLAALTRAVGRERLVIDLSCRKGADGRYSVVTDRWQRFTQVRVEPATLDLFARHAGEFLIHAADVEGRCQGIATDLAALIGSWAGIPVTYAGGISSLADLTLLRDLGQGRLDFTVGSALDLFGGTGITYAQAKAFR